MRFMQTMINDLERVADIYYKISKLSVKMHEAQTDWPEEARAEMVLMMDALRDAVHNMHSNVSKQPGQVDLDHALVLEDVLDDLRDKFRDEHYTRLESGAYSTRAGVVFIDVLNRLERIGDHVLNVNEAACGRRLKATRMDGAI